MAFNMMDFMSEKSKENIRKDGKIENIDVRKLRPASDGKNFYHVSDENVNKIAASIELLGGVQENLVVKPIEGTDEYEVIAGHTRRMASLKLVEEGKEQYALVPCKVEGRNDSVRDELILIMTNSTQRVRTDAEKMYEAQRLRELITEYRKEHDDMTGSTQEIIADILGMSKSKVGRLDNINRNLAPELKEEFEKGTLNTSTANEIAGLSEEKQKELGEELKEKGSLSMRDVFAKKMMQVEEEPEQEDEEEVAATASVPEPVMEVEKESFSVGLHIGKSETESEKVMSSEENVEESKVQVCRQYDCFMCAKDCDIRAKERYCREAPLGNPFNCTTMHVLENLREEVGMQCQFINEELAEKYPDGDSRPCCKDCKNPCGYQCRRAIEARAKKQEVHIFKMTTWYVNKTGSTLNSVIKDILKDELEGHFQLDPEIATPISERLYLKLSQIAEDYKYDILKQLGGEES